MTHDKQIYGNFILFYVAVYVGGLGGLFLGKEFNISSNSLISSKIFLV